MQLFIENNPPLFQVEGENIISNGQKVGMLGYFAAAENIPKTELGTTKYPFLQVSTPLSNTAIILLYFKDSLYIYNRVANKVANITTNAAAIAREPFVMYVDNATQRATLICGVREANSFAEARQKAKMYISFNAPTMLVDSYFPNGEDYDVTDTQKFYDIYAQQLAVTLGNKKMIPPELISTIFEETATVTFHEGVLIPLRKHVEASYDNLDEDETDYNEYIDEDEVELENLIEDIEEYEDEFDDDDYYDEDEYSEDDYEDGEDEDDDEDIVSINSAEFIPPDIEQFLRFWQRYMPVNIKYEYLVDVFMQYIYQPTNGDVQFKDADDEDIVFHKADFVYLYYHLILLVTSYNFQPIENEAQCTDLISIIAELLLDEDNGGKTPSKMAKKAQTRLAMTQPKFACIVSYLLFYRYNVNLPSDVTLVSDDISSETGQLFMLYSMITQTIGVAIPLNEIRKYLTVDHLLVPTQQRLGKKVKYPYNYNNSDGVLDFFVVLNAAFKAFEGRVDNHRYVSDIYNLISGPNDIALEKVGGKVLREAGQMTLTGSRMFFNKTEMSVVTAVLTGLFDRIACEGEYVVGTSKGVEKVRPDIVNKYKAAWNDLLTKEYTVFLRHNFDDADFRTAIMLLQVTGLHPFAQVFNYDDTHVELPSEVPSGATFFRYIAVLVESVLTVLTPGFHWKNYLSYQGEVDFVYANFRMHDAAPRASDNVFTWWQTTVKKLVINSHLIPKFCAAYKKLLDLFISRCMATNFMQAVEDIGSFTYLLVRRARRTGVQRSTGSLIIGNKTYEHLLDDVVNTPFEEFQKTWLKAYFLATTERYDVSDDKLEKYVDLHLATFEAFGNPVETLTPIVKKLAEHSEVTVDDITSALYVRNVKNGSSARFHIHDALFKEIIPNPIQVTLQQKIHSHGWIEGHLSRIAKMCLSIPDMELAKKAMLILFTDMQEKLLVAGNYLSQIVSNSLPSSWDELFNPFFKIAFHMMAYVPKSTSERHFRTLTNLYKFLTTYNDTLIAERHGVRSTPLLDIYVNLQYFVEKVEAPLNLSCIEKMGVDTDGDWDYTLSMDYSSANKTILTPGVTKTDLAYLYSEVRANQARGTDWFITMQDLPEVGHTYGNIAITENARYVSIRNVLSIKRYFDGAGIDSDLVEELPAEDFLQSNFYKNLKAGSVKLNIPLNFDFLYKRDEQAVAKLQRLLDVYDDLMAHTDESWRFILPKTKQKAITQFRALNL